MQSSQTNAGLPADHGMPNAYEGLRRLSYFLRNLIVGVSCSILVFVALVPVIISEELWWLTALLILCIVIAACVFLVIFVMKRLRNIGASAWYTLLMPVPLVSGVLGILLLALPEGYAQHRKLDTPGTVILWITVGCIVLCVFMGIIFNLMTTVAGT